MESAYLTIQMNVFYLDTPFIVKIWQLNFAFQPAEVKDSLILALNGKLNVIVETNQQKRLNGPGQINAPTHVQEIRIKYAEVQQQCPFIRIQWKLMAFVFMIFRYQIAFSMDIRPLDIIIWQ